MGMKKAKEKKKSTLFKLFFSLIVLILVFFGIILLALDPIAKVAIEDVAPDFLGVKMKIDSIRISPFRGRVEIRKFTMYNPENCGYTTDYAMHFGYVNADVDLSTVLSKKKIVIEEIALKDIAINYETNMFASNLQDIISNVKKLSKEQEEKQKEENTAPPPNLQINLFTMDNVGLYVSAKGAKSSTGVPVKIEPMGPLGTDTEGITVFDFVLRVMGAILFDASKQGVIKISDTAKEAVYSLIGTTDNSSKDLKNVGNDFEKAGKDLKKSLKGLFGK
ncbi:MAG: hypothetical protein IKB16_10445 [Lentisphaeria bacterium]|nr:hypothetical protein [Lentisphaeria bacterium]